MSGDETRERGSRRQGGDAQDPHDDRAAHRRHAVAAVQRIAEDPQPLFTRPAAAERVGGVGEPVLVERAGDHHARDDRDGRGHRHRDELGEPGRDAAHGEADQAAGEREPRHAPGELWWF